MSLWSDFKAFAFKGSLVDLAIAFVIGAAFSGVVQSLVKNIIMPAISYATPKQTYQKWHFGRILIGPFIGDLLNFFIIAVALFLIIVVMVGNIKKLANRSKPVAGPTMKECPFCISNIPIKATRCPQCTSAMPEIGTGPAAV